MRWPNAAFFLAPIRALYSRELYAHVAQRWRGLSFLYLAYLLAACWVPAFLGMYRGLGNFMATDGEGVLGQIPSITVADGQVSTDVDEPYFIRSTGNDPFVMIIDTTGQITSLDDHDAKLLLTRDKLILKKNERETRAYDLSGVQNFHIDESRVRGWLGVLGTWGPIVLYPFAVVGSLTYRILQALFYSVFGLLLASTLRVSLRYSGILSVTAVALTPAILLKTVLDAAGMTFPFRWVVLFALSMAFVGFGLTASREHGQTAAAV